MLDSRRLAGMLDSRRPTGMLGFCCPDGILSLVLPNRHVRGTFFGVCTYFLKCVQARFWKFLDFLKTKKNRSGLTSRLAVVSRLDLLYVSENSRLSIPNKPPWGGGDGDGDGRTLRPSPAPIPSRPGIKYRVRLPLTPI